MKTYIFTALILIGMTTTAFQPTKTTTINLTGELANCRAKALKLMEHDGIQLRTIQTIPMTLTNGKGIINAKINVEPGFYFIGETEKNYRVVLLGNDKKINLKGTCGNYKGLVIDSEENKLFNDISVKLNGFSREFQNLIVQYRQAANNPAQKKQLDASFADLDKRKTAFINQYKKSNPVIYKYLHLNTYLSYQANKQEGQSEADYFSKNYLTVDFKDATYNRIPHLMDVSRNYAQNLTQIGLSSEEQIKAAKNMYSQFPEKSIARKSALAGVTLGFMDKNNTAFAAMSDVFITEYGAQNPGVVQFFSNKKKSMKSFIIGGEAPELAYNSPEGEVISLTSLRGKIVMIDFWASWCRPCRKENPHVKKLYSKYKDKGFDILAVSLDRRKAAWVGAIAQDGLPWHHISDLKGWQSEAAKIYGVNSIPQTVLVDREGKIIARNLRGPALDKKLAELFPSGN